MRWRCIATLSTTLAIGIGDAEAAEEFVEGITGICSLGTASLRLRPAFSDLNVDHCGTVVLHQCGEIREASDHGAGSWADC